MRAFGRYLLVAAAAVAAVGLAGCKKLGGIIPEDDMAAIYADMFLSDQWLRDNQDKRKVADSTLFFDPIFKKYGYSFEQYDRSVVYYADHPDKFADITSRAAKSLGAELDRMKEISDIEKVLNEAREKLHKTYKEKDFSQADSLEWRGGAEFLLWPESKEDTTAATAAEGEREEERLLMEAEKTIVGEEEIVLPAAGRKLLPKILEEKLNNNT